MNKNDELDGLYSPNEVINTYLSYSRIADFSKNGPKSLIKKSFVGGEGVKIGSITDDWLFEKETFYDKYEIYEGEKPTATLGKLVDIILKNYVKLPNLETVTKIVKKNEFWKRSKEDVLLSKFNIPEFWKYLEVQYNINNKVIVTSSQLELGKTLADILLTHEHSKYMFSDVYERINQYKFEFTYKKIKFRGIIDMVLIDHENKTIRLVDLKTGQPPYRDFLTSFLKYRYYFQEAVYMKAIKGIMKKLDIKDYSILPFQFLYIGRTEKIPITFDVTQKWHDAALNGFTYNSGYKYKGLNETLEEIIWHFNNQEFIYPKEVKETNGLINLNDKFFKIN